ncbi:MAG: thiamine pyrophosphate-dependent dehydrogenase E1 component subunit alpha [Paenibacillus dendritiformis]|uniref:thiamine pyrophosphate-dependent dehydrogenase E1 component subunit alpha n=1 Tax=Paenibacillus dendritiformis TaxID=130049 RepID=UPI00143DA215|nr:thiamine pyrophosphate-dependent dehydrogenase E1 component subunit alpha [Paenibacillus dendritiformis]MDU5144122.1 thiamine pyrophosphate-dependent dehydrogenase E1 component subunit alpha [Paenibacillus dendritiformis]NKI23951.1 thiamine pyrophosphate-dependent dehydrogenase E1 component subunit alpha [Paenibacillus dendritiformis]NRF99213.1 thiamine pyrophosphate-dependent dehydrogenase E1 component subunit alpha [Paenibacillus dendritiformis]GIO72867.1 2-oxoisovalerate dehydrogenase sub
MNKTGHGQAENRHQALGLSDQQVLEMYRNMVLARKVDERMWILNRAGKIPFLVSCQGHEAAQIGAAYALDPTTDFLCPYYRDMGMAIVFGMTANELMLSAFAKAGDPNSGGRQMPGHYGSKRRNILSGSSVVSSQVPHAVGIAFSGRMQGEKLVALTAFGDGGSNQGEFHEAANFAGVHKLPVIFFCENNKYAISVPFSKQAACESIADRAKGYGFPGISVDGNDPLEVYRVTKEAADRARRGEGPTLIEAVVYRLVPHSSDDDDRTYRSRAEVEEAKRKDPLITFSNYLKDLGLLDEPAEKEIHDRLLMEVDAATEYAENAPDSAPEDALKHVYAE